MARGFAAWIADGIIEPVADPDTLATVFRALVVGLEMQHRVDPEAMDIDTVTAALARVLDVSVTLSAAATASSAHHPTTTSI
jgi:anti-sigma factor RsiW